ncbi:MAG: exonuclease domain-containing protein [Clostridium sp.]|jgi:inhibitor of KinA sporulation pathway (predicted exonuclease)|nr:exonuclease domain-containing protein [Clostridium sp.]
MNYIIFDLEWNQGPAQSIMEEVLEIGAIKLNDDFKAIDRFTALVKPQVIPTLSQITGKLLHLTPEDLEQALFFPAVMKQFLAFCTSDTPYMFCTWGVMDLTILQKNMAYYGMAPFSEGPMPFYDVQKLFSLYTKRPGARYTLETAVDSLHLKKKIPFHRAYQDSFYTARILKVIHSESLLQYVSYDTFHPPKDRKHEVKVVFDTYAKYISRCFANKPEALSDHEISSTKCYVCRCNLKRKAGWFSANGHIYYALANCPIHGDIKYKLRAKKSSDSRVFVVKTSKFITATQADELRLRQEIVHSQRAVRLLRRKQKSLLSDTINYNKDTARRSQDTCCDS